jgi:CRISPR-associated endonuclease Csn1
MDKILGLDLGTNSIGWAIVERDNESNCKLIDKGVHIFQEGVKIEKGVESSKAAERTQFRASRRHYFRRKLRKIETLKALLKYDLCPYLSEEALSLWLKKNQYPLDDDFIAWQRTNENDKKNPYYYRHVALTKKLDFSKRSDRFILGRALYHLSQRRGFLSNRA